MTPQTAHAARLVDLLRTAWRLCAPALTLLAGCLIVYALVVITDACLPLSDDDQFEYNLLVNTLRDHEHPTEANAFIREEECRNWRVRAERYRRIKRMLVNNKVDRYVEYCREKGTDK